jgi:hypothetical protein
MTSPVGASTVTTLGIIAWRMVVVASASCLTVMAFSKAFIISSHLTHEFSLSGPRGDCKCSGLTPSGNFETNEDGTKRSLISHALTPERWEAFLKAMNKTFPKTSSEPPVQTLDTKSKSVFLAGVTKDFAK